MKKRILFFILTVGLMACGSPDKQTQLRELESQRDELSKKIEELKSELRQESGIF